MCNQHDGHCQQGVICKHCKQKCFVYVKFMCHVVQVWSQMVCTVLSFELCLHLLNICTFELCVLVGGNFTNFYVDEVSLCLGRNRKFCIVSNHHCSKTCRLMIMQFSLPLLCLLFVT